MWKLGFILILFSMKRIHGENLLDITKFNRTYMLFVSEDVPIDHMQIIDTYDLSFCSMYSIKPQQDNFPFEILLISNKNCTLNLHVIHLLDREKKSMYTIKQELIHKNLSIIIQLSIIILDVNDHIPQFENEHFYFNVQENISPGTFIGRVQAYDADIFLNGKISYTLFSNDLIQFNNRTMFRIDKDTGEIFLCDSILDYETKREYTFMVEAKDYGDIETTIWPSVSSHADVTITIEDVNDEKPEIILTMPDEDKDKDSVRIMNISKPQLNKEQNHFINSFHSSINLIENDAEMILLTKEEPLPANTLLAFLHLRDNDQLSNGFLTLNLQTYIQCSTEQIFINNITFCQISNLFHLSIFRSNIYGLFTSQILDREQYENYIIHLIANDNGNQSIETSNSLQSELFIYLILLDINDNIPIFNQTYFHIKIDENQSRKTILTRVHAYDIDKGRNGTVHYELMIKKNQVFFLDKYSGILRAKYRLDREQCEFYRIGIRAYDLGYPQRKYSSIIIVDIEINNINDHIPYFMHDIYHFDLEENAPIGKIVGRLTIDDRDEQEPIEQMINLSTMDDEDIRQFQSNKSNKLSRIDYSMVNFLFVDSQENESLSGLFSIDSQGFIHTLVVFDRELQSNYSFYISMYDPILKSYAHPTYVIITILDENDNIPYEPFLSNSSILSIEQIDNNETIIYEFKPIDHDDGLNGFVSIECLNCTSIFYFYIRNSLTLITRANITIPNGIYTLAFVLRDHGLIIFHQRLYTLTFNLTHRSNIDQQKRLLSTIFVYKEFLLTFSWHYFLIIWLILVIIALWTCCHYYQISINEQIYQKTIISDLNESNEQNFNNNDLNLIAIQNHSTQIKLHSRSFLQLHNTYSHCQLSSSIMNSRETILTNAAINTSYREDNNDIWLPMNNNNNNNQILYENISSYQFQPIDHDFSSNSTSSQTNNSHLIQHPIPISNTGIEGPKKQPQYVLQTKRNSTVNIDSTIRPYGLSRSITSDHLGNNNNTTNRLYYYPSVQDVLDALNRRSFDKESYV